MRREELTSASSSGNFVAYVALFFALGLGTAWAVDRNAVRSQHVKNNTLKSVDLQNGNAVTGKDVVNNSLGGADINEGSLGATATRGDIRVEASGPENAAGVSQVEFAHKVALTNLGPDPLRPTVSLKGSNFLSSGDWEIELQGPDGGSCVTVQRGTGAHFLCNADDPLAEGGRRP